MAHLRKRQLEVNRSLRYGQRVSTAAERGQQAAAESSDMGSGRDASTTNEMSEVNRMTSLIHERWTKLMKSATFTTHALAERLHKRQETLLLAVEVNLKQIEFEKLVLFYLLGSIPIMFNAAPIL